MTSLPATDAILTELRPFLGGILADRGRAERFGDLLLYVREGPGYPFYATLTPDGPAEPTAADVAAVRARQRELGVPEKFEWVHENAPGLAAVAEAAGLSVHRAPLMVLDELAEPAPPAGATLVALDPADPAFADRLSTAFAVVDVGFRHAGTATGAAGPAERDAARRPADPVLVAREADLIRAGRHGRVLAVDAEQGAVAAGALQSLDGVAEVAGVATLPSARRRGLASAVTAALARTARAAGTHLVYISADSDAVARIYTRLGFHHIGTSCIAEPAQ